MLWGGRFSSGPDPDMLRLTRSVEVDMVLLPYDVQSTRAHAATLVEAGLLTEADEKAIGAALDDILGDWEEGRLQPDPNDEDVHSVVERELTERTGEAGRRIHAGRSRNDLVATDLRLWCRDAGNELVAGTSALVELLGDLAERNAEVLMPGFTHLQTAQPVSLGFHLLAHAFPLARDVARFRAAVRSADVSSLGAGALAGTTLPLDAAATQQHLGMAGLFDNAMDAVAARDFAADLVYACASCAVTLSRLAEEIVIWASPGWGFVELSDEWSTGSSMMPQKKNPDMAELIRGRAAPVIGGLTSLLTLVKGLPLAYDRDLQEDKAIVFTAVATVAGSLQGMTGMVGGMRFDEDALARFAGVGGTWATDAAELLVERGFPFREAHEAVGRIVSGWTGDGPPSDDVLEAGHDGFRPGDGGRLTPREGMGARSSHGGTAPARVKEQVARLRELLNPDA